MHSLPHHATTLLMLQRVNPSVCYPSLDMSYSSYNMAAVSLLSLQLLLKNMTPA